MAERELREREAAAQRAQAAKSQNEARQSALRNGIKSYEECLAREAASLIPYSAEGAEIIANVSETNCRSERSHLTTLVQGLYGTSPETRKALDDIVDDAKKRIVAGIVTLRAAAEAARINAPRPGPRQEPQSVPVAPGRIF
jgi:hypothetical protein